MTELNDRMNEAATWNGEARVIVPAPFKGGLSTMVRCVQLGTNEDHTRPKYGYQISTITEGGPVLLIETDSCEGPAMGAWPEANEMALSVLGWHCTDPDEVGDGYGDSWSDALREWNFDYGEGLDMIHYDIIASQCGNACRTEFRDGRYETVENYTLTEYQALLFVTYHHGLTWLDGDPAEYATDDDRAACAALDAFWSL